MTVRATVNLSYNTRVPGMLMGQEQTPQDERSGCYGYRNDRQLPRCQLRQLRVFSRDLYAVPYFKEGPFKGSLRDTVGVRGRIRVGIRIAIAFSRNDSFIVFALFAKIENALVYCIK